MPIYVYRCHVCDRLIDEFKHHPEPDASITCPKCGGLAERSIGNEHFNTDCVSSERWSDAMGVAPNQVDEARRTFPDSTYDSDGRLLIKSRKHKIQEMKRRGYSEIA